MRAFSLVELSIVLVILGLLTGGILAGQSLVRAAELRAIPTEHARYNAAIQVFRDKYLALPGDFRNATRFWSRAATTTDCTTNSSAAVNTSTGTCDGDDNGTIGSNSGAAAGVSREELQFWRQLALAGLIEGTYTGLSGSSNTSSLVGAYDADADSNVPASKLNNASWGILNGLEPSWNAFFAIGAGHYMIVGNATVRVPANGIIRPEEAWNIDNKMDDGKPAYGKLLGVNFLDECSSADSGSSTSSNFNASYRLTSTVTACALLFTNIY